MNNIKTLFTLLLTVVQYLAIGQTITSARVFSDDKEPLIGATVLILGTDKGSVTDANGAFKLETRPDDQLIISFVSFKTDTISVADLSETIVLESAETEIDAVTITAESTMIDNLEPRLAEVILESELLKAACCNLSESFETNASVDVSFADAVTGAKVIQMLGLDGTYVQINRENTPLVRGLSGRYGLGFVPGTWIQSIDVGKGAGSVINGYESMTGQINLEFKKPEVNEKLYLNAYANSFGRTELNYNQSIQLNDRWDMGLLMHTDYFNNSVDNNNDGFLDLPKSRQINVLNRYKYQSEKMNAQIGIHYMTDQKAGGQNDFGFNEDAAISDDFGFQNFTRKMELFGKVGLLFPRTPYKGWGFIYSISHQDINSAFGRTPYAGKETTGYANLIHQNILGNSFHQIKTGASLLYDDFEESLEDSAFSRTEIVPGAFLEYNYLPSEKLTLVLGNRIDLHNLYGVYYTPRIHIRYQLQPSATIRASIGRGYRTPNVIAENTQLFFSSRNINILEEMNPEVSWNMGTSMVKSWMVNEKELRMVVDYFHTRFENQMIVDMDASASDINIYNLTGQSFAHSFQVEASYTFNEFFEMKSAYKYYNVQATLNNQLQRIPFVAQNRFFVNGSYATKYDKWKMDATLNWIGRKRMPDTSDRPTEYQSRAFSPDFFLLNGQVARGFKWGSIYLGGENLLNFTQSNPIIDPENPFGNQFDGTMVWGPIAGRLIYTGIRFKIK